MVSIRRRRLLALSSGRSSFMSSLLPRFLDNVSAPENPKPAAADPMPSVDVEQPEEKIEPKVSAGSSNASGSSSSKEQPTQQYPEVKRRKRHRRKQVENQEPCVMRGVYFKNMKWQAAIKVDKKQIHLGTVGSQEEAAHLYDRAAFMCGREPNLELPEGEKQELGKYKWDEFLALTRSAITSKKHRRSGKGLRGKAESSSKQSSGEGEAEEGGGNGFSASEDAEAEASAS
ncbi:ethylene-responsive transcription factor-like protein At4g13040 isoform X2 [Diospyros lotus]|uniref:ethylene-responsive transcription factor-like protein At4g13040 isoform X2 n=1 Tax=Diospyros lotus TaxID=55363 RepID=UPI002256E9D9|nr:ethylene-responsive transcription factor-like protein At4g13040 isoform X2 [Diospyros lotus]